MAYQSKSSSIKNVQFGENVQVVEPCNLYECFIGKDSFVGPFVEIQKGGGYRGEMQGSVA